MNIEIDLDDYISEEEKKQIVKDTFVAHLKRKIESDYERILANTAYEIVFKAVDEEMNGEVKETIKNKAITIINNLSEFSVFREKNNGFISGKDSIAQQYLNDAVNQNKELIYSKVKELVDKKLASLSSDENHDKTTEIIEEVVGRVIHEKLVN